ncbi:MAG: hypothetical protein SOZ84_11625 [Treponema sp.]|nr:hypothetical protein [Treponema sp.]
MTWSITMADMRREGFEEGLTTGLEQGREEGAYERALETAKAFLAMRLSPEQVAQGTNLPLETVLELDNS